MKRYYKVVIPALLSLLVIVSLLPPKLFAVDVSTISDIDFLGAGAGEYNRLRIVEDVNGDSIPDLISFEFTATGSIYVVFGSNSPVQGSRPLATSTSYNVRVDGGAGNYISDVAAYDVNGDGKKDLIIPSAGSTYGGSNSGSTFILFSDMLGSFGTTTGNVLDLGTSTSYNVRYDGGVDYQTSTNGVFLSKGDVNSDGKTDLMLNAIGTSFGGVNSGSVFVILSSLVDNYNGTTGNNLSLAVGANYNIRYDGRTSSGMGQSQKTVGDVNGDGLNDFVIGAYQSSIAGANSGEAFVIFSALITAFGTSTGNNVDLSVGSNYNIDYRGGTTLLFDLSFGSVITIGDLNNDGLGDLIIKATDWEFVFFSTLVDDVGASTGNNKVITTTSNYNIGLHSDFFTINFASDGQTYVTDTNGDGARDLIVSAFTSDLNTSGGGLVFVLFSIMFSDAGTTTGNVFDMTASNSYNVRLDGTSGSNLGLFIDPSLFGDIDGDSKVDLILSAGQDSANGSNSGSAYIVTAAALQTFGISTGNVLDFNSPANYYRRIDGTAANEFFAYSGQAFLNDFNNDGFTDIIVSGDSYNTDVGRTWVILTGSKIINADPAFTIVLSSDNTTSVQTIKQAGTKSVNILKGVDIIADVNVDFSSNNYADKDWSTVQGDTDLVNGMSFINNLNTADGVVSTHSLYIPIPAADTGGTLIICPNATSLVDVTATCTGAIEFTNGQTQNVNASSVTASVVSFGGNSYWKASGLNGTGGIAMPPVIPPPVPPLPPPPASPPPGPIYGPPNPTSPVSSPVKSTQVTPAPVSSPTSTGGNTSASGNLVGGSIASNDIITSIINALTSDTGAKAPTALLAALGVAYVLAAGTILLAIAASGGSAFSLSILLDILRILGLLPQKRKKGYVYSTISKDPVSLALIDIKDPKSNKYLGTMITGFDGAYYEPYLESGDYLFKAKESAHRFPTMNQRPAGLAYYDYYKGEDVLVKSNKLSQAIIIPMDPSTEIVPEGEKRPAGTFFLTVVRILNLLLVPFWLLSILIVVTYPTVFNLIIAVIYTIIVLIKARDYLKKPSLKGKIVNKNNGQPIYGAIVQLKDREGQLIGISRTDKNGFYDFFVDRGNYSIYVSADGFTSEESIGSSIMQVDLRNENEKDIGLKSVSGAFGAMG